MSNLTRTLIASSLTLGLALSSSAVMAKDPPKTDHAAMTHADRHDSNEPVTDSWITTKVKADLLASSNVPGTEVKVETVNGVVSLSGTVATQAEKDKAVTTAKGIKGVTRVDAAALKVNAAAKR
ncbi:MULTISPECIES: BON domain-containing protein [Stenotrophomonas]|jgi:hyperosmotically inducible protein|uniref:BON domain-containing protein n=1 Tax=Stenotrophomonas TaxID=40323 RepID=UPI0009A1D6AF|nr:MULTISPECIES: BON domain-containing protein [Stenotrophomonas]AWH38526.1 BON domain-containing protein [Stenotrophomonas sp. ZAC14D1_NAIMI4_6]AWH42657.1 BON domain-containing protein [Stenotrophomonas sp. ZAC14D1_NAIMI4_1]AWH47003.1 BON domain-containing protein [Stenotrophomonas sp. ZAC14A_NAIMI4_1]MBK0055392.1 BON domain-containing protein [Stenotrophomonas sp. S39]MDI9275188.1 BON domain-containing protein [Stenotrophomonas sp. PFBMAA-4]